ncbi:RSC complex subunit Rsc9 [Schizosaccharomyces cryophilus OY26]|uniref:RSC complex subunit Rsc9 n=1 Tax=Schizosaccharomyces cryophilus (strain OY26 / ATCC MYA-4695 / CBS 11777 / NBRC 106824 / NRRL Y48691) TaxID=653667 RepID=S9XJE7_SCHCR|nr:RSC complex subunit Rsc9 [Schizosaccharomyces cryophilus OY26]EPY53796.1 RSC complex subunit Rsc9 [Schizosaccharomyces cryophilus OY26]
MSQVIKNTVNESIYDDTNRLNEEECFLSKVDLFARDRGINFEATPKVTRKPISLFELYKKVKKKGGYDAINNTENGWSDLAGEFRQLDPTRAPKSLQNLYFKNLIAWEMYDLWHLQSPPPQLLELSSNKNNILQRVKTYNLSPSYKSTDALEVADTKNSNSLKNFYKSIRPPSPVTLERRAEEALNSNYQPLPNAANFSNTTFPIVPVHPLPADSPLQRQVDRSSGPAISIEESLGQGIPGPPLLIRMALALKSRQEDEVDWAVCHLVKVSFERYQEFKLERLPFLAECLVEALGFQISLVKKVSNESDITQYLDRAIGIALVLRNSVLSSENAKLIAKAELIVGVLESAIRCAKTFENVELLHYCLDISETISSYLCIEDEKIGLYLLLCSFLNSSDNAVLIATLRTLARLALNDRNNRLLQDLDEKVVIRIISLTETNNEELVAATLDFLYQYTTYRTNTSGLLSNSAIWILVNQLTRLMMYQAQERVVTIAVANSGKADVQTPNTSQTTSFLPLPYSELQQLVLLREPERSVKWMRCCFESSPDDYVLQTDIWQMYCSDMERAQGPGLMAISPADFIKVSSHAFYNARAMTVSTPLLPVEYVINGIKRRELPISLIGEKYQVCRWKKDNGTLCGETVLGTKSTWAHLQEFHIFPQVLEEKHCRWGDCTYYIHSDQSGGSSVPSHQSLLKHILTHLYDNNLQSTTNEGRKLCPSREFRIPLLLTAVDEQGDATGIALTATLVLRNLVRSKQGKMLFSAIEGHVLEVSTMNPAVAPYVSEMLLGQI